MAKTVENAFLVWCLTSPSPMRAGRSARTGPELRNNIKEGQEGNQGKKMGNKEQH